MGKCSLTMNLLISNSFMTRFLSGFQLYYAAAEQVLVLL